MKDNKETDFNDKLVEVYAGELWQSTMIKNMLEENGIEASIENELMSTLQPSILTSGGVNPAKVMILASDYDVAVNLIQQFQDAPN